MFNKISSFISSVVGSSLDGPYCYYYERLTAEQKAMYKKILLGLKAFSHTIKLSLRPINEISRIFDSVLLDNPTVFYVSTFHYSTDLYKQFITIKPDYKYAKSFVYQSMESIDKYLQVFDQIKHKSDIEKEIYVHDFCVNNFQYDNSFNDYSHSVLGLIYNKTAVCEGISKFVKLVLDYLSMKSLVVVGKAKNPALAPGGSEMHAWNIVELQGNYYHLDVTFDLTLTDRMNRYDYFNLSDDDIKKEHIIMTDVPQCITTGNDYFSLNSLIAYNSKDLEKLVCNNLMQGKRSILVKLKNVQSQNSIVDRVIDIAQQQYVKVFNGGVSVEVKYNPDQLVFEIDFI